MLAKINEDVNLDYLPFVFQDEREHRFLDIDRCLR
jgi:hypothetical protein